MRNKLILILAALSVGLAAVVAVALADSAKKSSREPGPGLPTARQISGPVDPRLIGHFAVLRKPASASAKKAHVWGPRRPFGVNPRFARYAGNAGARIGGTLALATSTADNSVVVIPGSTGICVTSGVTGTLCAPTDKAIHDGIFGLAQCGPLPTGTYAVYGLVPDGAAPTIHLSSGATVPISFSNNVVLKLFSVADPARPASISLAGNGGTQVTPMAISQSMLQDQCDDGSAPDPSTP
jgi:hypothetical protein